MEITNASVVGRLKIKATDANNISAVFDSLFLTTHAQLYIYSEDGKTIMGPITYKENIGGNGRHYISGQFKGSGMVVELISPVEEFADNIVVLEGIQYGIDPNTKFPITRQGSLLCGCNGNFEANPCAVNPPCLPDLAGLKPLMNGICKIDALYVEGAGGVPCTGFLLGNTCNENIGYILTDQHCALKNTYIPEKIDSLRNNDTSNYLSLIITFHLYSRDCKADTIETRIIYNGAFMRAYSLDKSLTGTRDFVLLKLTKPIYPYYIDSLSSLDYQPISFLGWTRDTARPKTVAYTIGHPKDDIQKITIDSNARLSPNTSDDWKLYWSRGIAQTGSSGSPLINGDNKRVIGLL